jgi:hypothetical protein
MVLIGRAGCDKLAGPRPKQGVSRSSPRSLSVNLSFGAGDFRLEDFDALFQFSHPEQLKIFPHSLDQALASANADFCRLFHDGLCLSGFPMGRYPTARAAKVQVCADQAHTGSLEPSP